MEHGCVGLRSIQSFYLSIMVTWHDSYGELSDSSRYLVYNTQEHTIPTAFVFTFLHLLPLRITRIQQHRNYKRVGASHRIVRQQRTRCLRTLANTCELVRTAVTMPLITASCHPVTVDLNNIKTPLFEHQRRVLLAANTLEQDPTVSLNPTQTLISNVGVLSCPPGAGKSLIILCLALNGRPVRHNTNNVSLTSGSSIETRLPRLGATVIVVPDFLLQQWQTYVIRHTTLEPAKYCVLGNKNATSLFLDNPTENVCIILCTGESYQMIADKFSFTRVVFDEVDTIKIPACKRPVTDMIWCVSSNKERIMSAKVMNRGFLRQMLSEFRDLSLQYGLGVWECIMIFTDPLYLQESLQLPTIQTYDVYTKPTLDVNKACTKEGLSVYFSYGMYKEVADCLGIKYIETPAELYQTLVKEKQDLFLSAKLGFLSQLYEAQSERLLTSLHEDLRKTSDSFFKEMDNIKSRVEQTTQCPISFDAIVNTAGTMCCQNMFDAASIIPWVSVKNTCPLCRQAIEPSDLVLLPNAHSILSSQRYLTKQESFQTLVLQNVLDARILIFAGQEMSRVRFWLECITTPYAEFRGRVVNRTLHQFNNGHPNILLMDYNLFSTGLNLDMTTHLILCEDVPEHVLEQIIGRAHRVGRQSSLHVYKLKSIDV